MCQPAGVESAFVLAQVCEHRSYCVNGAWAQLQSSESQLALGTLCFEPDARQASAQGFIYGAQQGLIGGDHIKVPFPGDFPSSSLAYFHQRLWLMGQGQDTKLGLLTPLPAPVLNGLPRGRAASQASSRPDPHWDGRWPCMVLLSGAPGLPRLLS